MLLARAAERGVYREFFTMVVRLNLRLLARAAERGVYSEFFTMVLNLKFPGRGQRETPVGDIYTVVDGKL